MRLKTKLAIAAGPAALAAGLATTLGGDLLAGNEGPEGPHAIGAPAAHENAPVLGRADQARATAAVLKDPLLRAFGDPSTMTVDAIVPAEGVGGTMAGAVIVVRFPEPIAGTFRFFADPSGGGAVPGLAERRVYHEVAVFDMASVNVRVELPSGRIRELTPGDGTTIAGAEQAPTVQAAASGEGD